MKKASSRLGDGVMEFVRLGGFNRRFAGSTTGLGARFARLNH